ncbi:MAG TPA: cupin domain-containing protein [Alphaproteobacteria bacterium]|nr:cupin domain-containing protein [Alphaproteobacteria bacterium]
MEKRMKATGLKPDCNLSTVTDGRGMIVSFYREKPAAEAVLNIINKGKVRGFHCHPEFDETVIIVSGLAVETVRDEDGKEEVFHLSEGTCLQIPAGAYHTLYAVTDCRGSCS